MGKSIHFIGQPVYNQVIWFFFQHYLYKGNSARIYMLFKFQRTAILLFIWKFTSLKVNLYTLTGKLLPFVFHVKVDMCISLPQCLELTRYHQCMYLRLHTYLLENQDFFLLLLMLYLQHHCNGNFTKLHTFDESSIDRQQFNKERKEYWETRSQTL